MAWAALECFVPTRSSLEVTMKATILSLLTMALVATADAWADDHKEIQGDWAVREFPAKPRAHRRNGAFLSDW
jgi:hypothetical protein